MITVQMVALDSVQLIDRHRNDLGDIKGLADSMTEVGLLQPIVVTPEFRLVAGHRRLIAARSLGWVEIEAQVVRNLTDAASLLRAESDENTCRKAFTPTEAESIAAARESLLKPLAIDRMAAGGRGAKLAHLEPKTREAAAVGVGYGRSTIAKVREVKQIAEDETQPDAVREVAKQALADMDRTGKVDRPHKIAKQAVVVEETKTITTYLEQDQQMQDRAYASAFSKSLLKAHDVLRYDAERIGRLLTADELISLDMLVGSLTEFTAQVKRARSGLRVIYGGSE